MGFFMAGAGGGGGTGAGAGGGTLAAGAGAGAEAAGALTAGCWLGFDDNLLVGLGIGGGGGVAPVVSCPSVDMASRLESETWDQEEEEEVPKRSVGLGRLEEMVATW